MAEPTSSKMDNIIALTTQGGDNDNYDGGGNDYDDDDDNANSANATFSHSTNVFPILIITKCLSLRSFILIIL